MQYFPLNLVSVQYVMATLENYSGQPSEVQAAVKSEAIQKLGELAASLGADIARVADRYQLYVDRQKLTATISGISGAIATAVPVPIVQGVGVLVTLAGSLFSGISGKNAAKAQAEIQALALRLQEVQTAINSLQTTANDSQSLYLIVLIVGFFLYRIWH